MTTYNAATNVTTIANHKVYEAFGKVFLESGPTVDTIFGYTGRFFDDDTGLLWNTNRWYDPGVGRWLIEHPIGYSAGDPNLHRYVGNSVRNRVDPSRLAERPRVEFHGSMWIAQVKATVSGGGISQLAPREQAWLIDQVGPAMTENFWLVIKKHRGTVARAHVAKRYGSRPGEAAR